jgi:hypothetical protein
MLDTIRYHWREGERHGFPRCCRARYIVDRVRPSVLDAVLPEGVAGRVRRLLPRYGLGDGMVPCEAHALLYLATGDRSGWRKPLPPGECCQLRADLVGGGSVYLARIHVEPEESSVVNCGEDWDDAGQLAEAVDVWMFSPDGDPNNGISVSHCPWCGAAL